MAGRLVRVMLTLVVALLVACAGFVTACGGPGSSPDKVTLQLNWYPSSHVHKEPVARLLRAHSHGDGGRHQRRLFSTARGHHLLISPACCASLPDRLVAKPIHGP
jgi:hypothetical protein